MIFFARFIFFIFFLVRALEGALPSSFFKFKSNFGRLLCAVYGYSLAYYQRSGQSNFCSILLFHHASKQKETTSNDLSSSGEWCICARLSTIELSFFSFKKKSNYATESISFQRLNNDFCTWQLNETTTEPLPFKTIFTRTYYGYSHKIMTNWQ